MDRFFVGRCRLQPVPSPIGLNGIGNAYQICNDTLAPLLLAGDLIQCGDELPPDGAWPRIAVAGFPCGYFDVFHKRPTSDRIVWLRPVKMIIRL